jgi:SAM-dependent methyltransferase
MVSGKDRVATAAADRPTLRPMTGGESVAFDRIAADYDATRGGLARGQRIAAGVADSLLPGPVVEVGVGTGVIARELLDRGHGIVGVDLSLPMLTRAHARVGSCVAVGDGYRLPLRPRSVPNALTVWVTQLVPDIGAFLTSVGEVVAPRGRLVIVPAGMQTDRDEIDGVVRPMAEVLRPQRDGPDQLAALAEGADLRVVEQATTGDGVWSISPAEQADQIEARSWSMLWDLPDDVWEAVVVPTIAALRALPEPDRRRDRAGRFDVVVFEPR